MFKLGRAWMGREARGWLFQTGAMTELGACVIQGRQWLSTLSSREAGGLGSLSQWFSTLLF